MPDFTKFTTEPVLNEEAIKRIDQEYQAGLLDHLLESPVTQLDPATDPLGQEFEWLDPTHEELNNFSIAYARVNRLQASRRQALAAKRMRSEALTGSLAGGTDQSIFVDWVNSGFVAACFAAGNDMAIMLKAYQQDRSINQERISQVVSLLNNRRGLSQLSLDEKIAVALSILEALR